MCLVVPSAVMAAPVTSGLYARSCHLVIVGLLG
jgi:hypothetical protein